MQQLIASTASAFECEALLYVLKTSNYYFRFQPRQTHPRRHKIPDFYPKYLRTNPYRFRCGFRHRPADTAPAPRPPAATRAPHRATVPPPHRARCPAAAIRPSFPVSTSSSQHPHSITGPNFPGRANGS